MTHERGRGRGGRPKGSTSDLKTEFTLSTNTIFKRTALRVNLVQTFVTGVVIGVSCG